MAKVTPGNLKFWIDNNLNVLLRGLHGCGKTAMVIEAFEQAGLKYQYFSASTMDPWVDFIGVPKERTDENGVSYLDLVRPKQFAYDEVEAIILDEFNRSNKKVRNAVMELVQFKSINGKRFKNLKVIWAMINPDDDEKTYDVEALDPAQEDRFQIKVDVPYEPSYDYFKKVYGAEIATTAIEWWRSLEPGQQKAVSPRRLDFALNVYEQNGDIRFVLPKSVSTSQLINNLKNGSIVTRLKEFMTEKNETQAQVFLKIENNYNAAISHILKVDEMRDFFVPLLSEERIITLMTNNSEIENLVLKKKPDVYIQTIRSLAAADTGKLSTKAQRVLKRFEPHEQFANKPVGSVVHISGGVKAFVPTPTDIQKSIIDYDTQMAAFTADGTALVDTKEKRAKMYAYLEKSHVFLHDETVIPQAIESENLIARMINNCEAGEAANYQYLYYLYNFDLNFFHIFEIQSKDPAATKAAMTKIPEGSNFDVKL
jgi:hypothetical protein